MYISKVNHIDLLNNTIRKLPGGGLRVSEGEDINVIGNDISYNSLRSFGGTHGLVVTNSKSTRTTDDYRIYFLRNKVHHNYNGQYSWSAQKTVIVPHIDEGKGISLQRNQTTNKINWDHGRILVANNITYFNGFSGVHSQDGDRIEFINNTSFFNSYTRSIEEDFDGNPATPNTSNNGGNIGISAQGGKELKMINNISVIDSRLSKSAMSINIANTTEEPNNVIARNNIIYGTTLEGTPGSITVQTAFDLVDENTIVADPQFVDPFNFDYRLKITSPAIGHSDAAFSPTTDYNEDPRFGTADAGVLEFDANVTLWEGNNSSFWFDAGNWSNGVPLNDDTYAINIPTGAANYPEITTAGVSLKDVYVNSGGTLNITPTGSLTVDRDLTQEGVLKIASDASNNGSFILKGDSKGSANIDYDRYVTTNWHLISAPVEGQDISAFASLLTKKGDKYPLAPYNNSLGEDLRYTYYTDGGINAIASAGTFATSKGYAIKKTTTGVLPFSGTLKTDAAAITIANGVSATTGSNKWNIVGNPSTAFINLNDKADATHNFLTANASKLDQNTVGIYMWNGSDYDILNHSTVTAQYAALGQAFFVQAKDGGEMLDFTEEMQSHQASGTFSKTLNTVPEIQLSITAYGSTKSTTIKYLENTTTGLDPGYDAGTFSAESSSFGVFTHLVSDSEGYNFALQCLPNSNYESMIVAVGVSVSKNTKIKFTSTALNLPKGINVYLEDKETSSFNQIDVESATYTVVFKEAQNGIGRFYLHTTSSALSVNETNLDNVSVYASNKTLHIAGVQNEQATIKMFDILGKEVLHNTFTANGFNTIELSNIKTGVYVVNLTSEKGSISKKIALE